MHLVVDYGGVVAEHGDPHEQTVEILGVDPETDLRWVALPYFAFRNGFLRSTEEYLDLLSTLTGASDEACREYLDRRWLDPNFPPEHVAVLQKLAEKHTLVLFSNMVRPWIETVLSEYGVTDCFDRLVVSSEIQRAKPHPRGYVECLPETDEQVVMISDEYDEDLLMAETVGMTSVWVDGEKRDESEEETLYRDPDYRIESFDEFPDVVREIDANEE